MTSFLPVSTPVVEVTVPPGPLFAGSVIPLTLTCTISISFATYNDVLVTNTDVTWLNGTTTLSNNGTSSRVTLSSVSGSTEIHMTLFTTTLTLDPLTTFDNTTFSCQARARPRARARPFASQLPRISEVGDGKVSIFVNCK